jgi:nicotinate-nucleotide adenylyltransferase
MAHTVLFGGTFDPIHIGHVITARCAAEILGANRVLFIPAQVSPHKPEAPPTADGRHRLAMVKLAAEEDPLFAACDIEVHRPPPSYTIDTVETLRQQQPGEEFTLLLGADQLLRLDAWRRGAELLASVGVAVLPRPGYIISPWPPPNFPDDVWQKIRRGVLDTPALGLSSRLIRQRIKCGQSIHYLTPLPVEAYIVRHRLYR